MKHKLNRVFTVLTCATILLLCAGEGSRAQSGTKSRKKGVNVVVIDAGHGGKDPGAVYKDTKTGKEILEKEINMVVAKMFGDLIEKNMPSVKVVYTRKDNQTFVDLFKRGDMANKAGADLFVSIHTNAVAKNKTAPSGALTLVMGHDKADANLDIAMRENDVITYEDDYTTKYEGYIPGSAESFIIFSLMQYANQGQSMEFANILQRHYKKSTPMPDMGARQQNLLVLWKAAMPAVLTELGFINNTKDRDALTSTKGQKSMATALFNAFSEYKANVEGNSRPIILEIDDQNADALGSVTNIANVDGVSVATSEATNTGIVYRVQICSVPKKMASNHPTLRQYKSDEITERKAGSVYKYYVGGCYAYAEAAKLLTRVRKTTKDAFLVAFDGDKVLTLSEARKLTD